jgi:hypothetical protein
MSQDDDAPYMRIWMPNERYRTPAWHIKMDATGEPAYLFFQLCHQYDSLGAATGQAYIRQWEVWCSASHGQPGPAMPMREALKALAEIEAEADKKFKRVNDRAYEHFKGLRDEYHDSRPYAEHPLLVAEASTRLETDIVPSKTLRLRTGPKAPEASPPVAVEDDEPEPLWRTAVFRASAGYPRQRYLTYKEIRFCPELEKQQQGLVRVHTLRIGPESTFDHFYETGIKQALDGLSYHEWEHRHYKCPEITAFPDPLTRLSPRADYLKGEDFHDHHTLNPGKSPPVGRMAARKPVTTLKTLRFKPKP